MGVRTPTDFRIVFLIVNWNRSVSLSACLESLKNHISAPYLVIIIDNASTDDSRTMVRENHPEAVLIENDDNLGFPRANNQGMAYLKQSGIACDYLVFLNNDAWLEDGSLSRLLDDLDARPDILAAVPSILHADLSYQTGAGGFDLSLRTAFNYFFFLSLFFPTLFRGFFIHQAASERRGRIVDLDWASGVCFILKRSAVDVVGPWPEDFFMYAEDVAFCRAIKKHGRIVYSPRARVFHAREKDSPGGAAVRPFLWLDSLFAYYAQTSGPRLLSLRLPLLKLIFLGGFGIRAVARLPWMLRPGSDKARHARRLLRYCGHMLKTLVSGAPS